MKTSWLRLWHDMPNDPKWRAISRRVGRSVPEVLAVYVHMLTNASENAEARGELCNWSDEDVAAALDMAPEHVAAIREAMQGKTLDGNKLTGWDRRQPQREDGSSERAKEWRERKRTQANAEKRPDTYPDSETEKEITASKVTEQEPARAVQAEQRKQDFKFDPKDWKAQAKPAGRDRFEVLCQNAEGFGIDVGQHRETVARMKPENSFGYLRKLCVKDLRVWMPNADDALLHSALKGDANAKKVVFEAMTTGGSA